MHLSNVTDFGYEGLSLDALISRLRLHDVATLVDVRLNAISRKRGFSKSALRTALEQAGIEYVHLPELGNLRDNRAGYAEVGTDAGRHARDTYRRAIEEPRAQDAIAEVVRLAAEQKVALFCFEADAQHCHREQTKEAVIAHSRSVVQT